MPGFDICSDVTQDVCVVEAREVRDLLDGFFLRHSVFPTGDGFAHEEDPATSNTLHCISTRAAEIILNL